jgi:hypothetical protein
MENGLPEDFDSDGLSIAFDTHSGYVFFTNSEFDSAMMNGDTLETYYNTPYEGHEGFFGDLLDEYETMHTEDQEFVRNIAKNLGRSDELPGEKA